MTAWEQVGGISSEIVSLGIQTIVRRCFLACRVQAALKQQLRESGILQAMDTVLRYSTDVLSSYFDKVRAALCW
jgi:hypothetical protein